MESDSLCLFNLKLCRELARMSDDELWNFLLASEAKLKQYFQADNKYPKTSALFAYPHGMERFREYFFEHLEDYREGVVYTLVLDFCFEPEAVELDYWARCGFLDSSDSCDARTSDETMPPVDEDSDEGYHKEYFHLLDAHHVGHIIRAMEKNFDKLTEQAREDIDKIKRMKEICLNDEGYKAAYIYNNFY